MKLLVVERQKVRHNLALTREKARGAALIGVLKSDAYGLGLIETARIMRDEGIRRFAVGEPHEGALLRREGFTDEEILLLRSTSDPHDVESLLDAGLVASVGSHDAAVTLSGLAERRSTVAEAHLKIDTGLGRYGFLPQEFDKIQSVYRYMNGIAVSGVYTQINAFGSRKSVAGQLTTFKSLLTRLQQAGMETGTVHAAGSSALFLHDIPRMDCVRAGLSVSGRVPGRHGLLPVGYVECPVAEVRWLPKGALTGSRAVNHCRRPTRIGVVPVGAADGFLVERAGKRGLLSAFFPARPGVRLGNTRARVLGNVGLNHTVIDVTDLSCGVGEPVQFDIDPVFSARLPKKYV